MMAAETTVGRKIDELRVSDLKLELEARSLDTHGIKGELVKRLRQVNVWLKKIKVYSLLNPTRDAVGDTISLHDELYYKQPFAK